MYSSKFVLILLVLALNACLKVGAQEDDSAAPKEKVIPTEISEPPYQVGNLISTEGYYITDDGYGNTVNFRIVGNRIRIYWLDEDRLIMEPPYKTGNIRFKGSVTGPSFHTISPLSGDVGMGGVRLIRPPHIFNVIFSLKSPETGEFKSFSFRYSPELNQGTVK